MGDEPVGKGGSPNFRAFPRKGRECSRAKKKTGETDSNEISTLKEGKTTGDREKPTGLSSARGEEPYQVEKGKKVLEAAPIWPAPCTG